MNRAMMNCLNHNINNLCVYSRFSFTGGRIVINHRQHSQTNGSHCCSMSSFGSYSKALENLTLHVNQRLNQDKKDLPASQLQNSTYDPLATDGQNETKRFSIIQRRSTDSMRSTCGMTTGTAYHRLESGMVLLKNYLSLGDQVKIVNTCQDFGLGPGGFYQPCHSNGSKLRLQMMCFGRNWDPQTKYNKRVRSDGSEAPPLPGKLITLVETALQDSRAYLKSKDEIPLMYPDICIVNFYTTAGRLGLHQDRDESSYSLNRGLPVVSISIGDAAEFLYGSTRDVNKATKVVLRSGDVLIFGGKARHVFHGVTRIIPDSAPLPLLQQTMLRPGRLNLTFRQF